MRHEPQPARPVPPFAERRARLLAAMPDLSAAVFPAAAPAPRNGDVIHPYRQHSDLLYLTGFREPEAVAVLRKGLPGPTFALFVRPRDREMEVWSGRRAGVEGAVRDHGADEAFPMADLPRKFPELLREARSLLVAFGRLGSFQAVLDEALASLRRAKRVPYWGPSVLIDPETLLHELRLVKSPEELALMQFAAAVSCEAHIAAMGRARPGMREYELQAIVEYTFRSRGADGWGYPSIVGAGANGCVLHYEENSSVLDRRDLVLIDAGAEVDGYTADITRTFPAARSYKGARRHLYEAVLDVQKRLVDAVRPGQTLHGLQDLTIRWLTEHMVTLGLLKGTVDQAIATRTYRRFYMHNVSHWLGLDVHDAGAYSVDGHPRPLAPGMVLTIEPGLYVAPDAKGVPAAFRGIGVRIEDDVVVTESGPRVLTAAAPKEIADIEGLRQGA